MASKLLPCAIFKFGYLNLGFGHWPDFEINVSFCTEVSIDKYMGASL